MVEENAKNTSYRFVLEPAISDDGSCHSWELLTKDIIAPARNNASAPAFSLEGANKQVISSQADSLIKISRIWADFFPANTSNQPI